jgi:hypothetical protein
MLILCSRRATLLAGCAFVAVAVFLAPGQAAAQFLCTNANTGDADGATATGIATTACGTNAAAVGAGSTAMGNNAGNLQGPNNTHNSYFGSGSGSGLEGSENSAFGAGASSSVTGNRNSAVGSSAGGFVTGDNNSAIGALSGSFVIGSGNSALGSSAGRFVTGDNNIAIGVGAGSGSSTNDRLVVSNTVAIGNAAVARADGAVAIGNGAQATRANQVVLGTADYTYTTPGITSAGSRAAQTGPLEIVTSDGSGNLAGRSLAELGLASAGDIAGINSQIAGINARLNDLGTRSDKAFAGVAMAFAMAGTPTVLPNERVAFSFNWGNFQGQNGLALAGAVKLHEHIQLTGGIGYGTNQNLVGGRAGIRVGW